MIDRLEAVKRCKNCIYCRRVDDKDKSIYLGCSVAAGKWIVEVERCPITQGGQEGKPYE